MILVAEISGKLGVLLGFCLVLWCVGVAIFVWKYMKRQ